MSELPNSLQAEQALIAGVLADNGAYERVADVVDTPDFYAKSHQAIWQAIRDLLDIEHPADLVTVAERLENTGKLVDVGGLPYLGNVAHASGTTANVRHYAQAVRELSLVRSLIAAGAEQIDAAHNPEGRGASVLLEEAQARLATLAERGVLGSGWQTAKEVTKRAIERIDALWNHGGGMIGVSTGFRDLDVKTKGLEPGALIIVAARPSMGKTTVACQIAGSVASQAEKPVALYSLEMSADSLGLRYLSSFGRIDHDRLRSALLEDDEFQRMGPAASRLEKLNLHIDDQAGLSVQDIVVRAKRLHRQHGGLSLIVIDYLGLIAMHGKVESQNLGIGKITATLKGLAKSLKVPVVLLSQLNRDLEKRPNRRPIMADLRDSGSIEQDADLILFVYRDEVYHEDSKDKGVAEIIIGKQRNGPTGTVRLAFQGKFCRFDDLAPDWQPDPAPTSSRRRVDYEY